MHYRRFGRTELQVPALTFGGGWVGGVLIHQDEDVAFTALDRALAAGIDWIDTAASYGNGASERVIGRWLAARAGKRRPRISTKFRVDPAQGDIPSQVRRSVEESFARLGVSRVEVVTLHNQIRADGAGATLTPAAILGSGGVAETLERLKADGHCDFIGLTALGEPRAVTDVVSSGRFDVAQVYYNALNPTAGWTPPDTWNSTAFTGLLDACRAEDMGVMGIRIFAAGHLASSERHGREIAITANAGDAAEAARAAAVQRVLGTAHGTPAEAALRFGLACSALSTVVVGMAELGHLDQALAAERAGPLPAEAWPRLERLWRTDPAFIG